MKRMAAVLLLVCVAESAAAQFSTGGSVGWIIASGKAYVEPKLSLSYTFGGDAPFSWSGGVGAGYNFQINRQQKRIRP